MRQSEESLDRLLAKTRARLTRSKPSRKKKKEADGMAVNSTNSPREKISHNSEAFDGMHSELVMMTEKSEITKFSYLKSDVYR